MNPVFFTIVSYYFIFLISCLFIYIGGYIFLRLLNVRPRVIFLHIFLSFLTGLILFSTAVSIIGAGYRTIQLLYLPLLGLLVFIYRKGQAQRFNEETIRIESCSIKQILLYLFVSNLFAFVWMCLHFIKTSGFSFKLPQRDLFYYGVLSETLFSIGKENTYSVLNRFSNDYPAMNPYHYFELWINAGLYRIWHIPPLSSFLFITIPIFVFTVTAGIMSLWEYFGKINGWKVGMSIMLLFIYGLVFPFYRMIPKLSNISLLQFHLVEQGWKLGPCYFFMLSFLLMSLYKQYLWGYISICGLMIATFINVPALTGGIILSSLIFLFKPTWLVTFSRNELRYYFFLSILILFSFLLVYLIRFISVEADVVNITQIFGLVNLFTLNKFNILFGVSLQLMIIYFPAGVLFFFLFKKEPVILTSSLRFEILFLLLISLSGLLSYTLLAGILDADQLFIYPSITALNIILIFSIIAFISAYSKRRYLSLAVGLFFIIFCINNMSRMWTDEKPRSFYQSTVLYSDEYLLRISKTVKDNHIEKEGGFLLGKKDYSSVFMKNTIIPRLGTYLGFLRESISPVDISYNPDDTTAFGQQALKNCALGKFIEKQKEQNVYQTPARSQADFIQKYNLSYLIISRNASPDTMLLQNAKLVITDSMSGERFVVFDHN
jgi:hypothetical protein